MRDCPICKEKKRRTLDRNYCGQAMQLVSCDACGFQYVDAADLNQLWFDNYYLTKYKTDDKPYSNERLKSLAKYIAKHRSDVLDIGGMDGELRERLSMLGVACGVSGVDDIRTNIKYSCVVLSHTLEHIYDLDGMFERIRSSLRENGMLVVEVPIHIKYRGGYDHHWQHINKFRPVDLLRLFTDNGFWVVDNYQLPDYREYKCWRISGTI